MKNLVLPMLKKKCDMERITSKSNLKIVEAKKLLEKKGRDKSGLFLLETEKVIEEALNCGLRPKCFYVLQGKTFEFLKHYNLQTYELSASTFGELSTLVTPDGIIAEFYKKESKKQYLGGRFLILDGLQNPDNFGAIMRTALACDFKQIYTINCVDEYNPKTLRASMGNQFKLNIAKISALDIKTLFKDAKVYTASMDGRNIFEIKNFEKDIGFVVGNEGNGVSDEVKNLVKDIVSIPMQNGVESLNASVSAAVIMYHIFSTK